MSWRETEYEDLHRIVLPDDPPDLDVRGSFQDTDATREFLKGHARTWIEDDKIFAIVGVESMWKGVGTVWTLLTKDSRDHGVKLTLGVVRFIEELNSQRGFWRVQATVRRGDEPARLWILQLGFRYEGTMVAYGPDGSTHDMYARVRI